jgi:AmmeMemoRadiSam system radical SAM enzyme/AmmeMemoRadiSam system protein B/AmmeMemoRadiSam system protein A
MTRVVTVPPPVTRPLEDGVVPGGWWHDDPSEPQRIVCDLCPRECHLRPGDRGFCFVRENRDGQMVLTTYGRSTGFCIDPIEKKPLNQFYPGTSVLSFGTAGCNLGCKFCQNWSISKSREIAQLSERASPEAVAEAALQLGCRSVAFTYNDPVIWAEYAIDTARACRARGIKTVAVTAGYITPAARETFYEVMDAANVDLKGFTEHFYRHLTLSHLEPVKDTLRWLVHHSSVWTEITNLIIPRANDSPDELKAMCDWIAEALGPDLPVHFTAFHPDFRLTDRPPTPPETLLAAYEIATSRGLNYVYVGNVHAPQYQTTYCPSCRRPVIQRIGYTITGYALEGNRCRHCGAEVKGHYDRQPGNWGSRRQPVRIAQFEPSASSAGAGARAAAAVPAASIGARVPAGGKRAAVRSTPSRPTSGRGAMPASMTRAERPLAELTAEQENAIVRATARLLVAATTGRRAAIDEGDLAGAAHWPVLGAFVSLKRRGRLRGCCGFLGTSVPLMQAVMHAAQRTVSDDHRFPPVAVRELPHLDMDVWLLANQQQVTARGEARREAVEIGRHGLQIALGEARGLLLPGVAVEHGLDAEAFLDHVCLKADLPPGAWRDDRATLWTFEGHCLHSPLAEHLPPLLPDTAGPRFSTAELEGLAQYCYDNLRAMICGAAPSYFALGLPDGQVHGLVLSLHREDGQELLQAHRLALKTGLPLQSTLFAMTQGLAQSLGRARVLPNDILDNRCRIGLSILTEPALHGTVAQTDLEGLDGWQHLVLVMEQNRSAALFDPQQPADKLVAEASRAAAVQSPSTAQVLSLRCTTNLPRVRAVHAPAPAVGRTVRPPAVAGRFYPGDPAELNALVDECLRPMPGESQEPPRAWPAIMVPHAGLIYSGRIAGQTFRRVQIPEVVLILGPKHTPHGVPWAVAPHATWEIPGARLASDLELARQLVASIDGLQLDAAAHAQEHGIEVELPFIARLAPTAKVVGIAIGGGDLARCRQFAQGLAQVVASLPQPPLLAVSSDMNHYASDQDTRRLDAMALAAMQSGDPERLYETVMRHNISMCGVLPAVIVMETLRTLGKSCRGVQVAYGTSGDVSGERDRVVGYAGMLLGA